jgi:hypothetical protein
MSTDPDYDSAALNADVKMYVELDERIKDLQAQQGDIKARLRASLPVGKHETDVGLRVTISPNRRFNEALAADVLGSIDPELLAACTVQKVDSATTKKLVGDDVYSACMKDVGDPVVRIT